MIADLKHMDAMDLLASLPAGSVDAIITDPPFGTTHAAWDKAPDYPAFFRACWRALKKNGVLLVFSQYPVAAQIICQQRRWFRYEWVWEKAECCGRAECKQNAAARPRVGAGVLQAAACVEQSTAG